MNFLNTLQSWMERFVSPLAEKMNASKAIQALASGMISTLTVSLGVAAICILVNLPIPGWDTLMAETGISTVGNEIMMVTLSSLAIYMVINVSYHYAKNEGQNGLTCATITTAVFLMMMPVFISGDGYFLSAIQTSLLGSDGIFVGMVISLSISAAYCWLCKKNIRLKLPDSVPPNVSESLGPVFVSMIIFSVMAVIKYLITLTPYGNIFTMLNTLIATPVMSVGATPGALIAVYTFASLMWFFGVHPSPIMSTNAVIYTACIAANITAFNAGEALPYFSYAVTYWCLFFGGTANTIGLTFCMWTAKSERFKSLKTVTMLPNIFNINEPVIFGTPVMLNPIFFVPMILCTLIPGLFGWWMSSIFTFPLNCGAEMPWVTPTIITAFVQGGIPMFLIILACVVITTLLWYPFFKIADDVAVKEEKEAEAA